MSDAPSITDTLTHPTITNETSPDFAEALPQWAVEIDAASAAMPAGCIACLPLGPCVGGSQAARRTR